MDIRVAIDFLAGIAVGIFLTGRLRWGACTLAVFGGVSYYASRSSPEEKWYGLFMFLPIILAIFAVGVLAGALLRLVIKR